MSLVGCTRLACLVNTESSSAGANLRGIFPDPSEIKQQRVNNLCLGSWILKRTQSVVLAVNLFQLGKQVGPRGQNRSVSALTVPSLDYTHFNDTSE